MQQYKFVKVKCNRTGIVYPRFFLWVDQYNRLTFTDELSYSERLKRTGVSAFFNHGIPNQYSDCGEAFARNLVKVISSPRKPRYMNPQPGEIYLVRDNGVYMSLTSDMEVLESVYSDSLSFPIVGDVVICENDPENQHIERWESYFKGRKVHSMNLFNNRPQEEINKAFASTDTIAFHTTFSSLDWWGKLIVGWLSAEKKPKVLGYCHSQTQWEKAMELCPEGMDVEFIYI